MARPLRLLTAIALAVVWIAQTTLVLVHAPRPLALLHELTLVLIALATYSWALMPVAGAGFISALVLASIGWAWVVTHSAVLGADGAALILLVGVMGWQQRRRTREFLRLHRVVEGLDEQRVLTLQAVETAQQTHEGLERKLARYQQLHAIAEQLSRLVDLEAVGQLAVERAFELMGKSSVCLLYLADAEHQELALRASRKAPSIEPVRAKQGDQFDRYALRTHRPLLVNDVRRDFRFTLTGQEERPIASVIACPVMVGASAEGVLRLDSPTPGVYTQDDLRFLDILLDLVDTAITNARLCAQTQQ